LGAGVSQNIRDRIEVKFLEDQMAIAKTREIRNIAIVGTGVIGASWAALYLARGLNVVATDPAPNAEANLRRYIDAAWNDLKELGISPNGSRDHCGLLSI
jgi:3-hydroxyacyl-CoA dehydrogenase